VIVNLVGNAVKFTESGQVLLQVELESVSADRAVLHYSVSDSGIGIPADKQAQIFQAFRQADGSTTRRFGGTGLGLAISSTLVELMGGRIWVESAPREGSTFHFTTAVRTSSNGRRTPIENEIEIDLDGVPALIVDDNPVNRRVLHDLLLRWKMRPTVVESGTAALGALIDAREHGQPFALILLDANMGEMDGFEVARHIRDDALLTDGTIMMLSSSGQYGQAARCHDLGISRHLTKPVEQRELLAAIRRALGHEPSARAASSEALPVAMLPGPLPDRRFHVLVAEDNAVNQRLAVSLLERRGHHVTVAANGREALAILDRQRVDVVLMDVQMPDMGGFEATTVIRARERDSGTHVPIIAVTAHAMLGDRERCLQAGMDEYVTKPLDSALLYAMVERVGGNRVISDPDTSSTAAYDEILARLGGDARLLADVSRLFIDDAPRYVGDIRSAIDARDAGALCAAAHGLKGAAANFGASEVVGAARRLEEIGRSSDLDGADVICEALYVQIRRLLGTLHGYAAAHEPR
jgi:CheY-like chemotaxis protein